ncbi:hypothetical protein C8R45DRAFT_999714 [Mycena sanguinolenta]|nr:hypothetical protein C8R45DRAFT_999714 [Mycena sanguinolenta]
MKGPQTGMSFNQPNSTIASDFVLKGRDGVDGAPGFPHGGHGGAAPALVLRLGDIPDGVTVIRGGTGGHGGNGVQSGEGDGGNGGNGVQGGEGDGGNGGNGEGNIFPEGQRLIEDDVNIHPEVKVHQLDLNRDTLALLTEAGYENVGGLLKATQGDMERAGLESDHVNELKYALKYALEKYARAHAAPAGGSMQD